MISDPRALEDLRLVNEIRFGDIDAFKILYEKYSKLVVFLCEQRCMNEKQTKDVIHEVFIRLWSAVHKFDESKAPFIAWFVMYTRNIISTHLTRDIKYVETRKKYFDDMMERRDDQIAGTKLTFADIEKHLVDFEAEILGYRLVFGATFAHIAECVKMPVANVKYAYHRAINRLKEEGYDVTGYEEVHKGIHQ